MRTTMDIAEDALLAARAMAGRERIPLGDAISELVRRGASAVGARPPGGLQGLQALPRGRFALLPVRDEVVTPQRVRDLM